MTELHIGGVFYGVDDLNGIHITALCHSQGLRITLSGFAVLCAPAAPESTAFLAGAFRVFADRRCRDNQRQKSGRKFFTAGDTEIIKLRVAQFAKAVRELSILREVAVAPASHYAYLSKGTSMIS